MQKFKIFNSIQNLYGIFIPDSSCKILINEFIYKENKIFICYWYKFNRLFTVYLYLNVVYKCIGLYLYHFFRGRFKLSIYLTSYLLIWHTNKSEKIIDGQLQMKIKKNDRHR